MTIDESDGYLELTVRTPGGNASARLDLYEAHNTYVQIASETDDAVVVGNKWCEWLTRQGLPSLSHGAGFRVAEAVTAAIGEFKKKDGYSTSAD